LSPKQAGKKHRPLAADILLYDRIILPVPEDDPERERWIRKQWNPDDIALRVVQSAGHIIPVPWTAQLRAEWQTRWDQLRKLGEEVAYGLTGVTRDPDVPEPRTLPSAAAAQFHWSLVKHDLLLFIAKNLQPPLGQKRYSAYRVGPLP
jgi:hypothetical protein